MTKHSSIHTHTHIQTLLAHKQTHTPFRIYYWVEYLILFVCICINNSWFSSRSLEFNIHQPNECKKTARIALETRLYACVVCVNMYTLDIALCDGEVLIFTLPLMHKKHLCAFVWRVCVAVFVCEIVRVFHRMHFIPCCCAEIIFRIDDAMALKKKLNWVANSCTHTRCVRCCYRRCTGGHEIRFIHTR